MIGTLFAWFTGSWFVLAVGKWAAIALTISLFLLSLRRSGERAGRLAEQLRNKEKAYEIQRRMLEAASRRPRNRDAQRGVLRRLSGYARQWWRTVASSRSTLLRS